MEEELNVIKEMVEKKCCSNDCLSKIAADTILRCREQCHELQMRCDQHVSHLHLVLLGHMGARLHDSEKTSGSKQKQTDRSRTRLNSTFHGMPVCIDAFHFLHISRKVTRQIKTHFQQFGLESKKHGNVMKSESSKVTSFETCKNAIKFTENYALSNALVLPGMTAGAKNPDVLLLPCGTTKRQEYQLFCDACGDTQCMSYSLFCETLQRFLPGITILDDATFLSHTC